MINNSKFVEISYAKKIWAIGSIHSNLESFQTIKNHITKYFSKGDKLIFLGNIIGFGKSSKETLSSVIEMRNFLMSKFLLKNEDIIFLRGAQEEMFLKLLQLQTAPNPKDIIDWMFDHGVDQTLESYGINKAEVTKLSHQGTVLIGRWTKNLNNLVASIPGHMEYFLNLRHAAYSRTMKILFVNRGVDISRPLSAQSDCFWWGYQNFSKLDKPYGTFVKIVRGYESTKNNNFLDIKNKVVCSLFKPPLTNGKIIAGLFNDSGTILDLFESK